MIEPLTHDEIEQIIWDHWNTQGGSCRECGMPIKTSAQRKRHLADAIFYRLEALSE